VRNRDLDADGTTMSKFIFGKKDVRVWPAFSWLMIESMGGLLQKKCNFMFHRKDYLTEWLKIIISKRCLPIRLSYKDVWGIGDIAP
jgi:hypothetical protein